LGWKAFVQPLVGGYSQGEIFLWNIEGSVFGSAQNSAAFPAKFNVDFAQIPQLLRNPL
jgi:hypothetical protein